MTKKISYSDYRSYGHLRYVAFTNAHPWLIMLGIPAIVSLVVWLFRSWL